MRNLFANLGDWRLRGDSRQYVLENRRQSISWYYANLEEAIRDILDLKIKEFAAADRRHTLKSMLDAIEKAHSLIANEFKNHPTQKL